MTNRPGLPEVAAVHVATWWCVRILASQLPILHYGDPGSAGWWLVRLVRASLAVGIVVGWATLRGVALPTIGLGGRRFWRNGCVALAVTSILWLAVAALRGNMLFLCRKSEQGELTKAQVQMLGRLFREEFG